MGLTFNLGRLSPSIFTDSSLNIGIGAAPSGSYKFEVTGTGRFSDNLLISNSGLLSSLTIKSSSSTTGLQLYLYGLNATLSNQDNGSLAFQTNGTDRLTLASTGAATFSSTVTTGGSIWVPVLSKFAFGTVSVERGNIVLDASYNWSFNTNGVSNALQITSSTGAATFSSSVTAGGTITLNAPSANYATLNLNGAGGYGAELKFGEATGGYLAAIRHNYNVGTGLEFYTGGVSGANLRMYIAPSGNVGIGTSSPSQKLSIGDGTGTGNQLLRLYSSATDLYIGQSSNVMGVSGNVQQIVTDSTYTTPFVIGTVNSTAPLILGTNNTERMRITSGGNVLIGTTTDTGYMLRVTGYANIGGNLVMGGEVVTSSISMGGNGDIISASSNSGFLTIGSTQPIRFTNTSTSEWMRITNTGNVLIGTTTNGTGLLQLNGSAWIKTPTAVQGIQFGYSDATHGSYRAAIIGGPESYGSSDSGVLTFHTQNGYVVSATPPERMRITGTGNVGIGTTSPTQLFTLGGQSTIQMSLVSTSTTGASEIYFGSPTSVYRGYIGYIHNGNYMTFHTAAAERMRIMDNGNVLIGTTTDAGYILEVNGTARATNLRATTDLYLDRTGVAPAIVLNQSSIRMVDAAGSSTVTLSSISGNFQVSGALKTAAPSGGTAQTFKVGSYVGGAPSATGYVQVEINGTVYKLLTST